MRITGIKKYKYKYDLHVHTSPVSMCAKISVRDTVDYYASLGYSGIVLTNHLNADILRSYTTKEEFMGFYLNDYHLAKDEGCKKGLNIILGLEMRFPENWNDYLVYGVDENEAIAAFDYIFGDYETFYKSFKKPSNVIVQAHPFRNSATLQKLDLLDGIEVFNMHPNHNSRISVAAKLAAENPQLLVTGGTDFHHENHQGMCALCSDTEIADSHELARLIMSRDYIFDIWGNKIIPNY